jgi:hypothetical protein
VLLHVDQLERPADGSSRRLDDRLSRPGEGDDAAVVGLVAKKSRSVTSSICRMVGRSPPRPRRDAPRRSSGRIRSGSARTDDTRGSPLRRRRQPPGGSSRPMLSGSCRPAQPLGEALERDGLTRRAAIRTGHRLRHAQASGASRPKGTSSPRSAPMRAAAGIDATAERRTARSARPRLAPLLAVEDQDQAGVLVDGGRWPCRMVSSWARRREGAPSSILSASSRAAGGDPRAAMRMRLQPASAVAADSAAFLVERRRAAHARRRDQGRVLPPQPAPRRRSPGR